ncbi:MAG: TIGR03016 family PEP-CTERM system-associated outer membrane protein [Proteobacteria bacterium]|nr:TIGR03016 family PEP-CTERM system-associated outer membrane protein [Pseudomonadota bacterium]
MPLAAAQSWQLTPSVSLLSTLTSNVNLLPSDERRSDWVNQITPGLAFSGKSAHASLTGSVALPVLVYARTSENNYVAPQVNLNGTLEAIDKLFYIDTSANVSQQYANPFGARPTDLSSATQNRYTSQVYTVSPYFKGEPRDGLHYELRQTSTWSNATNVAGGNASGIAGNRSYMSEVKADLAQDPRPGGWRVTYDRSDLRYTGDGVQPGFDRETTQTAQAALAWRPDPTLEGSVLGGYEDNDFFATHESGAIYGGSIEWRPDSRTSLNAHASHRFFGASYDISFDHHTPLTVWSIKATRDLSTYPQQIGTLPAGSDVAALLNGLFSSRVSDPTLRQSLVNQVMAERGLPQTLGSAVALYAQQITLAETESATFGILGARNTVFVNGYRSRNQPVPGTPSDVLTPLFTTLLDNTQVGANVVWTHNLAANLSAALSGGWSRTTQNGGEFQSATNNGSTTLYTANWTLTQALTALTSILGGLRYQDSHSDVSASYREYAVFVGITHRFR